MVKIQDLELEPEVIRNPIFKIHLICMSYWGYIVSSQQKWKLFHIRKCTIFTYSFVASCCLIFIKVSKGFDNLAVGATSCATAFLYLSTSISMVNAYVQRKRVVRMVRFAHDDIMSFMELADTEEKQILSNTVRYLRLITVILWFPSVLAGVIAYVDCFYRTIFMPETVFNMPQVINGTAHPILLFKLFPFGEVYDHFVVGYLGSCYALFLGITAIPVWHTFMACLMKYLVVKFEIINKRLRNMEIAKLSTNLSEELVTNMTDQDLTYWRMKMCEKTIKDQYNIRWFSSELLTLISIPVFVDFIIFSILICFLFYALSFGQPSYMDYFFIFIYLFVMCSLLWLYHWHATLIGESNDDLCFSIYSSEWYTYPLKVQKSIRLIMMESNIPLIRRAILVALNLRTFLDVVKGGYSYFSILSNINQ